MPFIPDAILCWHGLLVALNGKRCILVDRDAKFSAAYRGILADAGITPVRLPPPSPNLNAH
jgi:putative transposase